MPCATLLRKLLPVGLRQLFLVELDRLELDLLELDRLELDLATVTAVHINASRSATEHLRLWLKMCLWPG
jgi:hypothetical protein